MLLLMDMSLPTKILLTGGTSGIGAKMRDALLDLGHHVIIMARTASRLTDHGRISVYDCDLADHDATMLCMQRITGDHKDIAIVIHNAALQYDVPLTAQGFDPRKMVEEVAINLTAPALITHHLINNAPLRAVVNISSGLAFFPKQHSALYCATKAALHSFSTSLRYQLQGRGITVTEAILPLVDTPMTHGRGGRKLDAGAAARAILAGVRNGRTEIYIGKAKLIPLLMRIAPALGRKILRDA
jgi:uncharacterized oxidoreductase